MNSTAGSEQVVLLDHKTLLPCGIADKHDIHSAQTPLHLAFSCYVIDNQDRLLLTRRSYAKKVWPGVWTNSFCGHPLPGESMEDAIKRRAGFELGMAIGKLKPILPGYRYLSPPYKGIVENEVCPVYLTRFVEQNFTPNPNEVAEYRWVDISTLLSDIANHPQEFSYWLKDQLSQLEPDWWEIEI